MAASFDLLVIGIISIALVLPFVEGWGKEGHEIVANIAYSKLSRKSRETVDKILNTIKPDSQRAKYTFGSNEGSDPNTPLGDVANWADSVRDYLKWSEPLHFIDVQEEKCPHGCYWASEKMLLPYRKELAPENHCMFVYERDCKDDRCVAGGIVNYTSILYNNTRSPLSHHLRGTSTPYLKDEMSYETRESLMFVTHFVGDIHQPLHVSRSADRGGNSIKVTFEVGDERKSTELHAVWDSYIIKHLMKQTFQNSRKKLEEYLLDLLLTEYSNDLHAWLECPDGRSSFCTSLWAQESIVDALRWAYLDVKGTEIASGSVISDEYYITRFPIIMKRLAMAGVRLADTLEIIFASKFDKTFSTV